MCTRNITLCRKNAADPAVMFNFSCTFGYTIVAVTGLPWPPVDVSDARDLRSSCGTFVQVGFFIPPNSLCVILPPRGPYVCELRSYW
jgi:hypothetical protein